MLGNELYSLASGYGGAIRNTIEITRFINSDIPRRCFYIEFQNGVKAKGRICANQSVRTRITDLLSHCHDLPLSPLIGYQGKCLLELWIEGQVLQLENLKNSDFEDAAVILRAIHKLSPKGVIVPDGKIFVQTLLSNLRDYLEALFESSMITKGEAKMLEYLARSNSPVRVETGIVHHDFCYDNLVRDKQMRLQVVDNNSIQISAIDFDIGKAFSKWPMKLQQRQLFLDTYALHRSINNFLQHEKFWSVYCLVRTIAIHIRYKHHNEEALSCLKKVIKHEGAGPLWPELLN